MALNEFLQHAKLWPSEENLNLVCLPKHNVDQVFPLSLHYTWDIKANILK